MLFKSLLHCPCYYEVTIESLNEVFKWTFTVPTFALHSRVQRTSQEAEWVGLVCVVLGDVRDCGIDVLDCELEFGGLSGW
jgi:hypothetical protein